MGIMGIVINIDVFTQLSFPNDQPVVQMCHGYRHQCYLLQDGNVACHGENGKGQLGIGSYTDQDHPQLVHLQGKKAKEVQCSEYQSCAVIADSDVVYGNNIYCWGWNQVNLLGSSTYYTTPTRVNDFTSPFITYTDGIERGTL